MSSNYPVIQFESTVKMSEKQIRKDFHNNLYIDRVEGDIILPIKEGLKKLII
jgi:hypothetical protein